MTGTGIRATSNGFLFLWIVIPLLLTGCGSHDPPELPPIDYYLVKTDSIGVEMGDSNYVFNWPSDAAVSPSGEIAVVDRMSNRVSFYSSSGEFIRSVGREGEGPGEFVMPHGLDFYSDGSFLVACRNGLSVFDAGGDYVDRLTWASLKPSVTVPLNDGGFIGTRHSFDGDENGVVATNTLGRWEGEGDPVIEFYSFDYDWPLPDETADFSHSRENNLISCASRDGRIFYSRSSADRYEIHGCYTDGSIFFNVLNEDYSRVRKSEEEIHAEVEYYSSYFGRALGRPVDREIRPDPLRTAIKRMYCDGNGRLWVWLDYLPGIVFRVYDMNGEILFHAKLDYPGDPNDLFGWIVRVDEYGFLAYDSNPEDYSRIYVLSLVESDHLDEPDSER